MKIRDVLADTDPIRGIHIGGHALGSARTFQVDDPATAGRLCEVADGSEGHAAAAVDAAAAALGDWSSTTPRERSQILRSAHEQLLARRDQMSTLISAENGKVETEASAEVDYAAEFFRWFSEEAVRADGEYGLAPSGSSHTLVTHKAVGVSALITPWNFPAAMAARKIAPALAAGCTVVLKPAAETPVTAIAVAKILEEVGLPPGVVNVVPTSSPEEVVSSWLRDERVRKVSFTGSTAVGRHLLRQAADRVVNASMELGGNAPFVVTRDADIPAAVSGAMIAKFRNSGQTCTAANRFYVHRSVVDEFTARFGAAVLALKVGPASDRSSHIGPLISHHAVRTQAELARIAVGQGATITHEATVPDKGWFFPPTVLRHVAPGSAILKEEIFGPIAPIVEWVDHDDLLEQLNDTEMGLAAYVYAGRMQDALRIAESIDAGMVGINRGVLSDPSAPFGGTKQSGLGREGGRCGMREFQETQYFSVALS
jgi:succinate-semialdehyde dehydrogenase/glutarate-semialdehyde dehydrogenase